MKNTVLDFLRHNLVLHLCPLESAIELKSCSTSKAVYELVEAGSYFRSAKRKNINTTGMVGWVAEHAPVRWIGIVCVPRRLDSLTQRL
jgi:hypothetical protein